MTSLEDRNSLARKAFKVSSHYDTAIYHFFNQDKKDNSAFKKSILTSTVLRYGENPHQKGIFYGDFEEMFEKYGGKQISFNNLVDIDAAVNLMAEFEKEAPTFAILKHTNPCGIATRDTVFEAWESCFSW